MIQFQGHLLKLDPGWRNWRPRMPLSQGNLECFSPVSPEMGGWPPKMVKHRTNCGGKLVFSFNKLERILGILGDHCFWRKWGVFSSSLQDGRDHMDYGVEPYMRQYLILGQLTGLWHYGASIFIGHICQVPFARPNIDGSHEPWTPVGDLMWFSKALFRKIPGMS